MSKKKKNIEETSEERKQHNSTNLMDQILAAWIDKELPEWFTTKDVKMYFDSKGIKQDNGEDFSKGWFSAVLSHYYLHPKSKDHSFQLERITDESNRKGFKYTLSELSNA